VGPRVALIGAYLDASAVVKLLRAEAESDALDEFLGDWLIQVSSELLRVELACFCRRRDIPVREAEQLLAGLELLPLSPAVLRGACESFTPPQRALDALHLASAEQARRQLGCFITYDSDQATAAAARGWRVARPGIRAR
jgi:uncharacterized protein